MASSSSPSKAPKAPATILITAGEPSGDRLGGALMAALKAQNPHLKFIGVGGVEMEKQGLKSAFPLADLSVMGLAEVIPAIPRILGRIKQLAALAQTQKPGLIVTIDAQDFSTRLAKAIRKTMAAGPAGNPVPHIHYVAPKVWAWRRHRVKKLRHLYTHLLSNLPFEVPFFKTAGIPTTYVGHSAVTTLAPFFSAKNAPLAPSVLAILPGSRTAELKRHWPIFLATYRALRAQNPHLTAILVLPGAKALHRCKSLAGWSKADAITPVYGEARFPALASATAALTKSGTNNLEAALLGVPSIVAYRMNPLTHAIAKWLVKVPFISLPNLILNTMAYPEFIQSAANPQTLAKAITPLLAATPARGKQLAQLKKLHTLMATPQPPANHAAAIILSYLNK